VRVAFAMAGEGSARLVKGSAVAAIADIPRSSRVSCEGVGVSVVRGAVAGMCGTASVRADDESAVGSDREEAVSSVNIARADKPSEAGEGKADSAGGGQGGSWCWLVVVGPSSTVCMAGRFLGVGTSRADTGATERAGDAKDAHKQLVEAAGSASCARGRGKLPVR
jgi:hypothetical protein